MPNKPRPENRHRMVRVEEDLWRAAMAKAAEQDTTVSAVIRDALCAFVGARPMKTTGERMTEHLSVEERAALAEAVYTTICNRSRLAMTRWSGLAPFQRERQASFHVERAVEDILQARGLPMRP